MNSLDNTLNVVILSKLHSLLERNDPKAQANIIFLFNYFVKRINKKFLNCATAIYVANTIY